MKVYAVVDEDGVVISVFSTRAAAQEKVDRHNEDRDPKTMEYFVKAINVRRSR